MGRPAWLERALDPSSPTTKNNESVRTTSNEYKGKEILFPTIRMENGKLKKYTPKKAMQIALIKGDFLTFDSIEEADAYSKQLSEQIGKNRLKIKK